MKWFLRSFLFIGLFMVGRSELQAQCTVSNIVIQNTTVIGSTANSCTVRFDASFNIENNNGNKFIFIHAWLQADYPNYFQCVNGQTTINGAVHAPDADDLGNEFLTLAIDNSGTDPVMLTSYTPDPSVPVTPVTGIQRTILPDGSANIVLTGVTTTVPVACGTPVVITADLWSSQSAHAQVAHCVNCGITYSAGFITAAGFVNCATLTYSANLTNNTGTTLNGYYRVYADINADGYFTPSSDTLIRDTVMFSIGANGSITVSGSVPTANLNQDLFLLITQTSGQASGASRVVLLPSTECAPLPVTLRSFTAQRTNRSQVSLRWETSTEINNRGFAVQKNIGSNIWQTIAFVNSQAVGGNSNSRLVYSYADLNTAKGITQYRLKQVDIDNKTKYSEVRAVRGEGQSANTIIYPNPSTDGNVNVVFDNQDGVRNVYLADSYGRIVKKWEGITSNTMEIKNLTNGLYTLRIVDRETGAQAVGKILVNVH